MKKIYKKKLVNLDFYKIFKPELTPKEMLELITLSFNFSFKINSIF